MVRMKIFRSCESTVTAHYTALKAKSHFEKFHYVERHLVSR